MTCAATGMVLVCALVTLGGTQQKQSKGLDRGTLWKALQNVERERPKPLPQHPGNIYLEGEDVLLKMPDDLSSDATSWKVLDDRGKKLAAGSLAKADQSNEKTVNLGRIGVGWYRIEFLNKDGNVVSWTSSAVLAPLLAPVSQDSPICIDTAVSWFSHGDQAKQEQFANLAALAGINWIRDRIRMSEIHPTAETFAENTTYDTAAEAAKRNGLKILQVFHDTPAWATNEKLDGPRAGGRFPRDLRVVYNYCRELSKRFEGTVQAWEPWNEANIENFGSHTTDEMCAFQKAAYLGFKTGSPDVTVGWNAYAATPMRMHTQGIIENETWSYFDTYNIHTYDWPHSYLQLWAPAREAACGRPMWITEADRGMKRATDAPWFDLTREGELRKAELMPQSYACSLFAGAQRHFHFILGHYTEESNKVQFGLLRLDLTPRPAYVALAATGRLLAGARCLGRWRPEDSPETNIYAFRAKPDGLERDVLVAWSEKDVDWPQRGKTKANWEPPAGLQVHGVYDYLGRWLGRKVPAQLTPQPIFVLLKPGQANQLSLEKPETHEFRQPAVSPIVLQLQMTASSSVKVHESPWSQGFVHTADPNEPQQLTVWAYNFSNETKTGQINVDALPQGCDITPKQWNVTIPPMDRTSMQMTLSKPIILKAPTTENWFRLKGRFNQAAPPVLAFQIYSKTAITQNN